MRVFSILAFAVALAAGSGGCASNCTQNILNICTPRFQWKDSSDGCACYLLDLAPPTARLWVHDGECTADINDFTNATVAGDEAELVAWTTNFTVVDNTLTFDTNDDTSCGGRRESGNATVTVSFNYAPSPTPNKFCGSDCAKTLKLYTNFPNCQSNVINSDDDNEPATSWRGRNSWSGRSRRSNSNSNTGNDGTRRGGGCSNPLFDIVIAYNESNSICQVGQCCGANFCDREQYLGDCLAKNEEAGWLVGPTCGDATCVPVYPGEGAAAGGATVTLGSSLENAEGAIPTGGHLDIQTIDVNNPPAEFPEFVGGDLLIAFDVNRDDADGNPIHGYLPLGTYIIVTVQSDALDGDIVVLRSDGAGGWINTIEDCAHEPTPNVDVAITGPVNGVYSVPICHTSTFIVTASGDSKDKKDKKDAKDLKVTKKTKPTKKGTKGKTAATTLKAPKSVEKKAAKKGKAEIAIGVGVAGGAVLIAGLGVLARRRANNKKTSKKTATPASTGEIAVVSV